ncbi:Short-chain dehydrogenase/reductase [Lachnellula subtilissima]|uniref:Short-chain dehydrogenase/reductase n=1 Tax=Lachnellula subtilissima TaxID=602034 RepID=A0A8H8UF32_9HELO|nr:Short-chain dehydrogenase/reductase [Lachnellula subtilissima]
MAVTDKTIVLITGANQGIGAAAATRLAKEHNYHLDLTSDSSIAAATTYLTSTYGHLDVLINNAGILLDGTDIPLRKLFDLTLSTNVAGPACLTESLLPLLRCSAQRPRLIFVSSAMGSLTQSLNPSVPWYNGEYKAYDASKAGVNILTANYARILADKEARVNSVCPGLVKTNLTGYTAHGHSPEVGAQRIVEMATVTGKDTDVTGTFSDKDGPIPW